MALPARKAGLVARTMKRMLEPLPGPLRIPVTFDNGTGFARHDDLHALDLDTYFCDPHAPWQKGGVENAIGRMRRFLPENRSRNLLRQSLQPDARPLQQRTPAEIFSTQLLHFKCDATP